MREPGTAPSETTTPTPEVTVDAPPRRTKKRKNRKNFRPAGEEHISIYWHPIYALSSVRDLGLRGFEDDDDLFVREPGSTTSETTSPTPEVAVDAPPRRTKKRKNRKNLKAAGEEHISSYWYPIYVLPLARDSGLPTARGFEDDDLFVREPGSATSETTTPTPEVAVDAPPRRTKKRKNRKNLRPAGKEHISIYWHPIYVLS